MSVEMTSGVLVAAMLEGVRFTLGPSCAVRKATLQRIGGFERMGNYAADDYMLGFLVAEAGETVALSDHIVEHLILRSGFWKTIEHQLSWMRSTRFSRPMGHLGTVLTFSVPYGVLGLIGGVLAGRPLLGLALLVFTLALKTVQSMLVGGLAVLQPAGGAAGIPISAARSDRLSAVGGQLLEQQAAMARPGL